MNKAAMEVESMFDIHVHLLGEPGLDGEFLAFAKQWQMPFAVSCLGPNNVMLTDPTFDECRQCNDMTLALMQRYPNLAYGFCYISQAHGQQAVEEIRRCVRGGMVGIKLWVAVKCSDGWNDYLNNWCNLFLRAATHWNGKIKYWELWNEPDCLAVIKPSNYGALLAHSYDLAHTNNLDVKIISGGVCGGYAPYGCGYISQTYDVSINHTGLFTQMKNKWGTYPLDYIGFHIYPNCNRSLDVAWLSKYFDDVHNAYATYEGANTTKKMFLTEVGWQSGGGDCYVSEATQAANLTSMFNLANSKQYIKCVTWFFLKDEPAANLYYGVFKPAGVNEADKKQSWNNLKTACTYEGKRSAGGSTDQPILDYFNSQGHVKMGNPYDNGGTPWVHDWDFGPVQDYDGGDLGRMTVFDSSDGSAYCARGPFFDAAIANHQALEFPLQDQALTGTSYKQRFDGGYVTWNQSAGTLVTLYNHKLPKDDLDAGFTASGNWASKTASDAYNGSYRRRLAASANSDPATWTISVPQAGDYSVYVRYPIIASAAPAATYEVTHASGTASVVVNQQVRGGRWNYIGSFTFAAGNAIVRLSSQAQDGSYISADAVRLIGPTSIIDTTPPTTPVVTDDGKYTSNVTQLHATWQSDDPESGIGRYEYAVGTQPVDPGSGYIVPWTSTGTEAGMTCSVSLSNGVTYYIYVRATNGADMSGQVGVSDGIRVDLSPPTRPVVVDDGDYTGDSMLLHCSWSAIDNESGIASYEYSIGTAPYTSDVLPLSSAGSATQVWVDGLNLLSSKNYYFTVRARNGAGVQSMQSYSDGISYREAVLAPGIADILALPDFTTVYVRNKRISALFKNRFYILESNGLWGMAVNSSKVLSEGSAVDVTGILQTSAGERYLLTGAVTPVKE